MSGDGTILVAGAGPAGLMLAAELTLAGAEVMVLDALPERSPYCRGFNLNARSLELLDRRGIAGRFLAEGPTVAFAMFADPARPLDLSVMDSDHPYVLGIAQTRVEELLEQWLAELGVRVRRGHTVVDLEQDGDGVEVTVEAGGKRQRMRVAYLAGCDGSRSVVRKRAGIAFPGTPATSFGVLADVELADPAALPFGMTKGEHGVAFVIPRPGYARIVLDDPEPPADRDEPVTLDYFQRLLDHQLGRRVELREPRWLTRFGNAARLADRYVAGRVVLAGDAAHIHPPTGAVGVNVALADAVNLGWKLAATVLGHAPGGLLDSYHEERHEAGERLLGTLRAQAALAAHDPAVAPVRELFAQLVEQVPGAGKYLAELAAGVSTRYDPKIPGGHPWLGRLAPDLELTLDGRRTSVAELLRPARPLLLRLGDRPLPAVPGGWVDTRDARCPAQPGLEGLLLRPDGHAAWVSTTADPQPADTLASALETWFGAPVPITP
ncbi:FAD-dependent monooxygenase [Nonomuraea gerenzanensis]|uniref:Monooxygenase, FAD-binding n=1 Tax=Nonomuraea gerenzanensis TaxID=93944 RepID=A0A1M4EBD5_9ACTN|nr:FAD-dependent monooxygenase [Nonomuraea gerenzanensis]UBU18194.1 FAD-dependent monooxygenase [Nonomuraea gerenzanensis]SBO96008.1 monooxygenase, FAD-binding [Nonomuraea gerenzanensis]